jgi:hypothetical protein
MDRAADYAAALLSRAAAWPDQPAYTVLTVPVLGEIAAREGCDFATALLYHRLMQSADHGPFIQSIDAQPAGYCQGLREATLAIVPGACWAEYPHTGADGQRLRAIAEELGIPTELIPVQSFGSLADNARIIADWLGRHRSRPVVLVSLSKGAADVKYALARQETANAFRHVAVWIDLSGIQFGSLLVGWWQARWYRRWPLQLLCWYQGYQYQHLQEVDRRPGSLLDFDLQLPEHLQVVHLVGFPLVGGKAARDTGRGDLALTPGNSLSCKLARLTHRRLAPFGPNDAGGNLLGDVARLPGKIYPVWNADHYLNPTWDIRPLIARVLHWTATEVQAYRHSANVSEVLS